MADDFTIDEGEGFPASNGDEFDPSEMSLDEIDSLLSGDDSGADFDFDALPVDDGNAAGFEDLVASSGEEYPDDFTNFEPDNSEFSSDLSQLDESVHLDEDFDFDLTDPLIDAEIDRLLDIEDDGPESSPSSSGAAPSWKESSLAPTPPDDDHDHDGFGDLGSLDLGDFSQPGEVPASAFHSEDQPFEWAGSGDSSDDHEEAVGFSDLDMDDEAPISLSDDELHNIDISADLADFSMEDEEAETASPGQDRTHDDDFLSDDEGPISLSEHELGDIAVDDFGADSDSEGFADLGDDFSAPSSQPSDSMDFETEEEDKDIALSVDELDHLLTGEGGEELTSSEEDSFEEMGNFGDLDLGAVDENVPIASDMSSLEESEEPIALSDDELGNLLSSGDESEDTIEPIDLDSLDLGEDSSFESDVKMGATDSSDSELDLSDFNFDTEASPKTLAADEEEESISLPISDLEHFGSEEESNPLDMGMDLGEFDELPSSNEEDVLESIGDFTSASDDDVLGSSASEEDLLAPPGDLSVPEDDFLSDINEDEPIALSDDELGNLLSSGEEEDTGTVSGFDNEESDFLADDNEPIALSDDELGNLLASEEEEVPEFSSSTEDSESEEPIALSDDELGDLLSSGTENDSFDFEGDSEESGDIHEPVEFGDFSLDGDSDEPIALSEDELGHLLEDGGESETAGTDLLEDSDEPISLPIGELDDVAGSIDPNQYDVDWDGPVADINDLAEETAAPSDWDLDGEADEPITLSNDELGNLLADEAPEEVDSEDLDALLSASPEATELDALGSMGDDIPIADLDFTGNIGGDIVPTIERLAPEPELNFVLDEYAEEGEASPLEEIRQASGGMDAGLGEEAGTPTQDEMKRILLYLDELLGNLPDDMIRDFSRSDYFELYKKLMKQIGV
ncbi:hypothetical protein EHQ27_01465 [Leptospira wolffii]|uniref:hypothetical protein n=1 Tax=Leptospira wolffii TaxID=409998 RepID=UPI00108435D7|nr:hypothetical protein [Leptospira wolffii]TGK55154.1 hypothetical protein EHQ32_18160 [Leptospira wolffii]TGK70545.1 hypothetical protein EHQ35_16350 [Leptospira wolffii]TGK77607.1 hypothetical protein EHQ27_01465 [Leptospira wolffii]TGL29918.1 hypothetical protein EHQ57_09290 [Leptospira wolffii]